MITLQWDMIPPVAMDNNLTVAGLAFHYLAFIVKCLANRYSLINLLYVALCAFSIAHLITQC